MIHSIKINNFRIFNNVSMNLGKNLTVIAGKNALGKSTLLGMIGNTCEVKIKEGEPHGRPIIQQQFRTEFSEIFKGSPKFDLSGSNKYTVYFYNNEDPDKICDYRTCRITWPNIKIKISKDKTKDCKRFRVISEKINNKKRSSKKYVFPVLYLGLSRLYPIGESKDETLSVHNISLFPDEEEMFLKAYKKILSIFNDEDVKINYINIGETDRKKGIGITTNEYDSLNNSAGQDNIGQIILSLLSFYRLKKNNPNSYKGGLLLIDEIDATLHPYAQLKLIEILCEYSRKLDLQIVFTTHSLTILKEICKKTRFNSNDGKMHNIELLYLTNANGKLEVKHNYQYSSVYNDLNIQSIKENPFSIVIYSEDDETRWFAKKLLNKYTLRTNFINIKMGCSNLLLLNKADPIYFSNIIFIVDGDAKEEDIEKNKLPQIENIIKLPGDVRPEEIIYKYLVNLDPEHELSVKLSGDNFTKQYFEENNPIIKYPGIEREQYKKWFKDYLDVLIEPYHVLEYWYQDNKMLGDDFIIKFKNIFNSIADRHAIPRI